MSRGVTYTSPTAKTANTQQVIQVQLGGSKWLKSVYLEDPDENYGASYGRILLGKVVGGLPVDFRVVSCGWLGGGIGTTNPVPLPLAAVWDGSGVEIFPGDVLIFSVVGPSATNVKYGYDAGV